MGLYVKYGSYSHAEGEVEYSIQREALEDENQRIYGYRERWDLQGQLIGDDPDDIDEQVRALAAAYSAPADIALMLDSGVSYQSLLQSDTRGGIRIVRPLSFPSNRGAAYVTYLPYQVTIEAEVWTTDDTDYLVSFEETLEFTGGGGRIGFIECVDGPPERQLLRRNTVYRATQSGRAVGLYSRPLPPAPIFPQAMNPDASKVTRISPQRIRGALKNYGVAWSYSYESASPLNGVPNVPT